MWASLQNGTTIHQDVVQIFQSGLTDRPTNRQTDRPTDPHYFPLEPFYDCSTVKKKNNNIKITQTTTWKLVPGRKTATVINYILQILSVKQHKGVLNVSKIKFDYRCVIPLGQQKKGLTAVFTLFSLLTDKTLSQSRIVLIKSRLSNVDFVSMRTSCSRFLSDKTLTLTTRARIVSTAGSFWSPVSVFCCLYAACRCCRDSPRKLVSRGLKLTNQTKSMWDQHV